MRLSRHGFCFHGLNIGPSQRRFLVIVCDVTSMSCDPADSMKCVKWGSVCMEDMSTMIEREKSKKELLLEVKALRGRIDELEKNAGASRSAVSRLFGIVNFFPDATLVINKDRKVIVWNRAMAELTGIPEEEMLGKGDYEYAVPFYGERRPILVDMALDPNVHQSIHDQYTVLKKRGEIHFAEGYTPALENGEYVYLSATASALHDEKGNIIGAVECMRDVTQRKLAMEDNEKLQIQLIQAQRMEAIGTLAGGVAHDFNNLLAGIQGYASMSLLVPNQDQRLSSNLHRIEELVTSGAGLTRQLLGIASGGMYDVCPTNINLLLEKCISIFGATNRAIIVSRDMPDDVWSVEVDQVQIEQVFLNLFINAGQAMPGGGNLHVRTRNLHLTEADVKPFEVAHGKYVCISVADTGAGMNEKTLIQIFDPFFTTKKPGKGTGLGLSSAYKIIKNHGGYITVKSKPGKGSTFALCLPGSGKEVPPACEVPEELLTGHETILVVDDEDHIADITREILNSMGYKVLVAKGGREAVAVCMEGTEIIDLIILDMIMPGMSGSKTFKALQDIDSNIKILLASGYGMDGHIQQLLDSGCKGFLQKPFRIGELSRKVRDALDDSGKILKD